MKPNWPELWEDLAQSLTELSNYESNFLDRCVLSASGLRFIHSGDEEDSSSNPHQDSLAFAIAVLDAYVKRLKREVEIPEVWLGMDARPTGPSFFLLAYQFLNAHGLCVKTMGHGPIPEVMAATHQLGANGFCYFTASHNPAGHNGFKLGLADGAVLNRVEAQSLIDSIKTTYSENSGLTELCEKILKTPFDPELISAQVTEYKQQSMQAYKQFAFKTIGVSDGDNWAKSIADSWDKKPLFLMDMNGSSRLKSIDFELLCQLGLDLLLMNDELGEFKHAIVPEGDSLVPLKEWMQQKISEGHPVLGGMVPDCDGDRGNLILPIQGKATALKAQETFALCALAEFSTSKNQPLACAVNGPSSLRLEKLLSPYQVKVERAEVGEANVLAKSQALKDLGYHVPISGEGSNGGNILDGATVRDPLMTLLSLIKFTQAKDSEGQSASEKCLAESGLELSGELTPWEAGFQLLPKWHTTDAFEGDALMPVPKIEHESLKSAYESLLQDHFQNQKDFWEAKGVAELEFVSNEGIQNISGPGNRPKPGKGGLQVFLLNENREALGFLWMRGSGTEPVFRVVVDWQGAENQYLELLELHRALISQATS